jgi:predicted ATPase
MEAAVRITNWAVLTGAPCSGKTAVINELARRGYPVVEEAARRFIQEQLAKGLRIADIKTDPRVFEGRIFRSKLAIEAALPAERLAFLDRALPDSIAYYRLEGLDPQEPLDCCRRVRYRWVFLLARLDFVADAVRSEPPAAAARIERLIVHAYGQLGYRLVQVPVMPVAERTDFVLAAL